MHWEPDKIFKNSSFRYRFVAIVILFAIVAIFLKTVSLQITEHDFDPVTFTRGEGRRMSIQAPRGDIVDRNGYTLAYSEQWNDLYLSPAGLTDGELNQELLALSRLLRQYGVEPENALGQYFAISSTSRDHDSEQIQFVFKQDLDKIAAWQEDDNLFNLASVNADLPSYRKVKLDPEEFFNYLLYDAFHIENAKAGGNLRYTREEAWQIMVLRYQIYENNWTFLQGEPVKIASRIPDALTDIVQEQKAVYPGILVKAESARRYTEDSRYFSHLLGYIGAISGPEYEILSPYGYHISDQIGKSGVEYTAERYLHGQNGSVPYGSWQRTEDGWIYEEGSGPLEAKPGNTVRLAQSLALQKVLYASFYDTMQWVRDHDLGTAKSAAAVMLDLKTGQVLAMGSVPSYQPNDFIMNAYDPEAQERSLRDLQDTDKKPMQNRAISEIYAPGSTFKPITAITGLSEGVIDRNNDQYECKGKETIGYKSWVCFKEPILGHGWLHLSNALVYSCNLYFYKLGLDIGIDALAKMCLNLGLGEYTNIDLPGEAKGIRPSPELKAETRMTPSDQEWYPADTCQTAIGQFDHAYTPLQLVRAIGGLVTNTLSTPHAILDIRDQSGELVRAEQVSRKPLNLDEDDIQFVRECMGQLRFYQMSNHTFDNFSEYPLAVGAKTGTAEVGFKPYTANAVFVCFAPLDDPEVAVACIVEGGGKGDVSSNIARDLFDAWFGFEPRPELVDCLADMERDPDKYFITPDPDDFNIEEEIPDDSETQE